VLSTLRTLTPHLIVVFGCGGNRDKSKRPLMGAIATEIADAVILTSDNPRSEKAEDIIADIKQGIAQEHIHKVVCELDREVAIKKAYVLSKEGSIVVMLGKGPDEYQMVGTVKTPFSESGIIKALCG
ncbi:MAG: glutamate ligase domain-containing protein, partial [Candidatus Babeliales bacterium]